MGIWSFLTRRRNARRIDVAVEGVATRSYAAVVERVRRRATTMRIAEARGYVRARALEIVHREFAALHKGKIALDTKLQTEIISRATETLVVRVLAELRSVPKAAPAPKKHAA